MQEQQQIALTSDDLLDQLSVHFETVKGALIGAAQQIEAVTAQRDALLLENMSYRAIVDTIGANSVAEGRSMKALLRVIHRQMRLWAKEEFDANPDSGFGERYRYHEQRQQLSIAVQNIEFDGPDMAQIEAAIQEASL
jgi:hypothetical protein